MPKIDIIIPVKNESENVTELTVRIHKSLKSGKIPYHIIFVDDRSTDKTSKRISLLSKKYPITLLQKKGKPGKAFSILEGAKISTAPFVAMIDGDLQYPPESIPKMYKKALHTGFCIANRQKHNTNFLRRHSSKFLRFIIKKFLIGVSCDFQSGLKVFKREVIEHLDTANVDRWSLDIPLIATAIDLGHEIESLDIEFSERRSGTSKVRYLSTGREIIIGAVKQKIKKKKAYNIPPSNKKNAIGAGVLYKGKKFITHTTLTPHSSALWTFERWQKLLFLLLITTFLASALINFQLTLIIFIAILTVVYFADVLFNIYIVGKSLSLPRELTFTEDELISLTSKELPTYTIMCPLYKESEVLPQFIESIEKIDWPKNKLDVMLLLEEDDTETLKVASKMSLPSFVRVIVVPHSNPKTKPKACNYGLHLAKGEYIVIYDAEDIPDPMQLKKAFLGFRKSDQKVFCLQAKLNYYNTNQNLLTRLFTAEYSLWFDLTLPGLQALNTTIPLGGTSNHFRTKNLKELEGWDPFNVTEDCDLGVRLFSKGYKTAIIDSTTLEEANSRVKNWIRQRSRWIKGYLQTYIVHLRHPKQFVKRYGLHAFIFQLLIGGKISFMLINPILWVATISYFALNAYVGTFIESLYPSLVFYLAAFCLLVGNFMYFYIYMIALAKREHWAVIKYAFFVPIYWLMMSWSAVIAIKQLITKPHYWEKTVHGFHLTKSTRRELSIDVQISWTGIPGLAALSHGIKILSLSYFIPYILALGVIFYVSKNLNLSSLSSAIVYLFVGSWLTHGIISIVNRSSKSYSRVNFVLIGLGLSDLFASFKILPGALFEEYAILSLAGKLTYLITVLGVTILFSSIMTKRKEIKNSLSSLFMYTILFSLIGFCIFGVFGYTTVPLIFNRDLPGVLPLMAPFVHASAYSAIAYYIVLHNYVRGRKKLVYVAVIAAALNIFLINFAEKSLYSYTEVAFAWGFGYLTVVLIANLLYDRIGFLLRNFTYIPELFSRGQKLPNGNLRILIYNWRDTKHTWAGGAESYIQNLASEWTIKGHSVTIFCGTDGKSKHNEKIDGVRIIRRGGFYTVYVWACIYYIFQFRGKFDVIIDSENATPFFTPLFTKKSIFLLIHHVHQEVFRAHLTFPMAQFAIFVEKFLMPLVYKGIPIITVSESSRVNILKLGMDSNISVVHPGIDKDLFIKKTKTKHPSFIYLGRLKSYKNVNVGIKAFARVLKKYPTARLTIAGEGDEKENLIRLAKKLKVSHAVNFAGRVSESEKAKLLATSWVALQPSLIEGWGITVIEANACGTPVIASDVAGLRDSVVHLVTGLLVKPSSTDDFATAMLTLIKDKNELQRLSEEAYQWSHNFSWDVSASAFLGIIESKVGLSQGVIASEQVYVEE